MAAHMVALARQETQPEWYGVAGNGTGGTASAPEDAPAPRTSPVEPKRVRFLLLAAGGVIADSMIRVASPTSMHAGRTAHLHAVAKQACCAVSRHNPRRAGPNMHAVFTAPQHDYRQQQQA